MFSEMQPGEILTIVLIVFIVAPIIAAFVSEHKNRDRNLWVFICFLCPPLLLLLMILPVRSKPPRRMFAEDDHRNDDVFPHRD